MYEIEIVCIVINAICLIIAFRDGVPSRDDYRRFFKFMITGKYEEPKSNSSIKGK